MFKWLRSRRKPESAAEPFQVERDSGEEEYASEEEDELEVDPSELTRMKTDNI